MRARVVSMPSWELFAQQDDAYRERVLGPTGTPRVAVEAGATLGWERYVGERGAVVGIDRYGASGPGGEGAEAFRLHPGARRGDRAARPRPGRARRDDRDRRASNRLQHHEEEPSWPTTASSSSVWNEGQSVWQDDISRDMLNQGSIRTAIEEIGIRGLTSNPTIFEKAIAAGTAYDEQIAGLLERDLDAHAHLRGGRGPRHPERLRSLPADLRRHPRAATASSRSKSLPSPRATPPSPRPTPAASGRPSTARI